MSSALQKYWYVLISTNPFLSAPLFGKVLRDNLV